MTLRQWVCITLNVSIIIYASLLIVPLPYPFRRQIFIALHIFQFFLSLIFTALPFQLMPVLLRYLPKYLINLLIDLIFEKRIADVSIGEVTARELGCS